MPGFAPVGATSVGALPLVVAAAGGGVTVNVPSDALTLTNYVPVVSTGVTLTVPTDEITFINYPPVVSGGVSLNVPTDEITFVNYPPAIQTGVGLAVPLDTLTITSYAPTIGAGITIDVPHDAIALTNYVPVVATGVQIGIPHDTLTLTGYVPTVDTGGTVNYDLIAEKVWAQLYSGAVWPAGSMAELLKELHQLGHNENALEIATGLFKLMNDAGTAVLKQAATFEDENKVVPYRGGAVHAREKLEAPP